MKAEGTYEEYRVQLNGRRRGQNDDPWAQRFTESCNVNAI